MIVNCIGFESFYKKRGGEIYVFDFWIVVVRGSCCCAL